MLTIEENFSRKAVMDIDGELHELTSYQFDGSMKMNLYGRLCKATVIDYALRLVTKKKRGHTPSPGWDNVTVKDIKQYGYWRYATEIAQELTAGTYHPDPYVKVMIEKSSGGYREVNIPTLRDKAVQKAITFLLNPVFKNKFLDCSYAYREGRGQKDAVLALIQCMKDGLYEVYATDIIKCFDNIPAPLVLRNYKSAIQDERLERLIDEILHTPSEYLDCIVPYTVFYQGKIPKIII